MTPLQSIRQALKLASKSELRAKLKLTQMQYYLYEQAGIIPKPTHPCPTSVQLFFKVNELDAIAKKVEAMRTMEQVEGVKYACEELLCVGQAARELGMVPNTMHKYIKNGVVPGPTYTKGKVSRYYHASELDHLRELLEEHMKQPTARNVMPKGYYTIQAMAGLCGVPHISFNYWLKTGLLPKPTTKVGFWSYPFYNQQEADAIKAWIDKRLKMSATEKRNAKALKFDEGFSGPHD